MHKLYKKHYNGNYKKLKNLLKKVVFNEKGIENIALITMIKDEEDVIYENLVWHFCIGFRKFIIVDNNSKDNSRVLINKFKEEVKEIAQIIIIDDPIVEYIQSGFITGAMKLANHIWPTVKWAFPVDADEFWYPTNKLDSILQNIPEDKNTILTLQYNYGPSEKTKDFNDSIPFYKSIKCRSQFLSAGKGKIATRLSTNVIIQQGNHDILISSNPNYDNYISGNIIGLNMFHFQRRSIAQVQKKYLNGLHANILGQKKGVVKKGDGVHWNSFLSEVESKGLDQAAEDRFNEFVIEKSKCIEDPLPMDEAFKLFHQITNLDIH